LKRSPYPKSESIRKFPEICLRQAACLWRSNYWRNVMLKTVIKHTGGAYCSMQQCLEYLAPYSSTVCDARWPHDLIFQCSRQRWPWLSEIVW
jgi:hypothetical protein